MKIGEHEALDPTKQAYAELQLAYGHFNRALFGGVLPPCMFTFQREKYTFGFFSQQRFGNLRGETVDEIAMNPTYFAVTPLVETMQTLVHEMAHLWQFHFGTPGRGRYHNDEWATKMESIGLMPTSTGRVGGKRTGDRIADYAIEGGPFLKACEELLTKDFAISWYDRFPTLKQVEIGQNSLSMELGGDVGGGSVIASAGAVKDNLVVQPEHAGTAADGAAAPAASNKSNRSKYQCPCKIQVWGKPGIELICKKCRGDLVEIL